jgi:hypothetical protein
MRFKFVADEPTLSDTLGFEAFVDRIYGSLQDTQTPFVFGLLGPWGCGKTSIQKMLLNRFEQDIITPEKPGFIYIPVWLDAWRYENQANMIYPLLYAFRQSRRQRIAGNESSSFGGALLEVVAASALSMLDVGLRVVSKATTGEAIKLDDIRKHVESVEQNKEGLDDILNKWAENVDGLSDKYAAFIEAYARELATHFRVAEDRIRFAVLIDDLDRCLPGVAVAVIENIKNHLCVPRCIYVLGVNPQIVERGIQTKYDGLDVSGREYLEKILNYSFYVPVASPDMLKAFGALQLHQLIEGELSEAETYEQALQEFGRALASCPFANPRKIKRILNSYLFFIATARDLKTYILTNIVKFLILAEYYPEMFSAFMANDDAIPVARDVILKRKQVQEFENRFGVGLSALVSDLSSMPGLLLFEEIAGGPIVNLKAHLVAVHLAGRRA